MDIICYQRMYAKLCAAASDAIDLLSSEDGTIKAKLLLEKALLEAEELYVSNDDTNPPGDK